MGCLCACACVDNPTIGVDVFIESGSNVNSFVLNDIDIEADCMPYSIGVSALVLDSGMVADVSVNNGGTKVCAALVCSVGPRSHYYLLVDEGYLLTVDGEYFTVESNE